MDLNLNTLKREILEYLESREFAVFRSAPGVLEGNALVLWDVEKYPDYQMFLDTAAKAGVKLILFAAREFASDDLDGLLQQLEECDLPREEQRDYQSRLRKLRVYEGVTCSLELAFSHESRLYVYELQPDWYEDFMELEDEIIALITDDDGMDDEEPLGGYYSKN